MAYTITKGGAVQMEKNGIRPKCGGYHSDADPKPIPGTDVDSNGPMALHPSMYPSSKK